MQRLSLALLLVSCQPPWNDHHIELRADNGATVHIYRDGACGMTLAPIPVLIPIWHTPPAPPAAKTAERAP